MRNALKAKVIPYWGITGGLLGGTFITMQSFLVPKVGVAILSVGYIAGQTVCSLFIDQIGLTGGGKKAMSSARIWAATITIIAVLVSVFDRLNSASLTLFSVVLSIFSVGAIIRAAHCWRCKDELLQIPASQLNRCPCLGSFNHLSGLLRSINFLGKAI